MMAEVNGIDYSVRMEMIIDDKKNYRVWKYYRKQNVVLQCYDRQSL